VPFHSWSKRKQEWQIQVKVVSKSRLPGRVAYNVLCYKVAILTQERLSQTYDWFPINHFFKHFRSLE
jgi:hypothetical protein